ncbi:MAG: magnesium/cobalt transporter CorA [Bacteroidota bacterium]|jgi:magnesium transporter
MKKKAAYRSDRVKMVRKSVSPPGASPGLIQPSSDSLTPKLVLVSYNTDTLLEMPCDNLSEAFSKIKDQPQYKHWLEIKGLGEKKMLEELCEHYSIHHMEMEDVVNAYQRPKMEEHTSHLFLVSRLFYRDVNEDLKNEQVSIFLFPNLLVSMQDSYVDQFESVRSRLRSGKGLIRTANVDYLAYGLMDTAIDNYFPLLEAVSESLDVLEDNLFDQPTRSLLQQIQKFKRELIAIRRAVFAERDKINDLLRTHTDFFSEQTKVYLKDTYDHTIQVLDIVDSYKEITASLMDIYLSNVSNRMNQIMKVLAIISTVFIPLTFVVGVYGMNFDYLPELHWRYGYPIVMIGMGVLVILQFLFFWRKGWLDKS